MALGGLGDAHQFLKIKTTLGKDKLLVLHMEGQETLGRLPEYRVEMVGNVSMMGEPEKIDIHKLVGTRANVTMALKDEDPREFNAFVVRVQRGERHGRYERFTATLRPWLWFATRTRNSMVFQAKSVKDIITDVLTPYGTDFEWRLLSAASYPKLDYCIQYNETDFDFVSRLMEEVGIYYFFEHTSSKHTMVLIDAMAKHKSKPKSDAVKWANSLKLEATIMNWFVQEEARSAKVTVRDFDYLATKTKIEASESTSPMSATDKLGDAEIYAYPADVVQNQVKPEAQPAATAATARAKVMLEGLNSLQKCYTGTTNTRDIAVGATFEIEDAGGGLLGGLLGAAGGSDRAGKYLVVTSRFRIEFADHEAIADLKSLRRNPEGFIADIVGISTTDAIFRPERSTPRPVIPGPLTATVVGASGNEIETDKHGRVKLQFHWDRKGKNDQDSSCWVRVAQPLAGKGFGFWAVPRIGHEVVVSFLGGDPDRPLITGSVHNDVNTIAYELPKLATVSGWRSHSSKEGTAEMFNELRFEDEKSKEYVWFQAQRDFYRSVKENAFDMVGKNETVKVKLTRKEVIGENWYMNVVKDVMHDFGKDLHVKVAADVFLTGGATYQVHIAKDMSAKVGGDVGLDTEGKLQIKATGDLLGKAANVMFKADSNIVLEAGPSGSITLKAGSSSVVLGASGVTIDGSMVKVNSGGSGGSATAASPTAPTDAKNQEDLTSSKETDYDKLFEDPIIKAGGSGGGGGAA
jgi:type VI secretion system secreted protein VgrG